MKLYEAIEDCFKTKATYASKNDIVSIEISCFDNNRVFIECNSEEWGYAFSIFEGTDYKKFHKERLDEIKDFEFFKI